MELNETRVTNTCETRGHYSDDSTSNLLLGYVYYTTDCILVIPVSVGNALILLSIFRFRRLRTRIYALVGNLAFSDFLIGVVFLPYDIAFLSVPDLRDKRNTCLLRHSLRLSLLCASVMNLSLVSFERYIAIIYPLKHRILLTTEVISGLVCACWIISITLGLLPLLGWNTWKFGTPCDAVLVLSEGYRGMFFLCLVISLFINFVLYVRVVKTAWSQHRRIETENIRVNALFYKRQPIRKDYTKTKVRLIVLGLFAFCWGPYIIYVLFNASFLRKRHKDVKTVENILAHVGLVYSSINWVIFGAKNSEFRKAFKYFLCCGRYAKVENLSVVSSM